MLPLLPVGLVVAPRDEKGLGLTMSEPVSYILLTFAILILLLVCGFFFGYGHSAGKLAHTLRWLSQRKKDET